MPLFSYKGYDVATGAPRKGKVEAESAKAARQRLRQRQKIIASDIKEEVAVQGGGKKRRLNLTSGKVNMTDISIMTRQFATLQNAHVPLDESLRALTNQVDNVVLRNTLSAVKDKVSEGKNLAEAMTPFPNVFNRLYVNMIKAGEQSGSLGVVLERLADFIEYQVKMRGQFFSAISYPAIMILAMGGIIGFLFVSIVPKLQKVFTSLKITLPWYSQLLIGISEFIQSYWWLLIITAMVAIIIFRNWIAREDGRRKFDAYILKVPLFGGVILRMNISRFTQTLSTLLSSGVPIVQALDITKNIITNSQIADVIEEAKIAVQEGQELGVTIDKSGKFPALVTQMIKTGEKTGELENMLVHVSTAYEAEVERKIAAMISLVEPGLIIVMGGVAVTVVAALMLPMLSVMSQVR